MKIRFGVSFFVGLVLILSVAMLVTYGIGAGWNFGLLIAFPFLTGGLFGGAVCLYNGVEISR